jgi:hypothetical protein
MPEVANLDHSRKAISYEGSEHQVIHRSRPGGIGIDVLEQFRPPRLLEIRPYELFEHLSDEIDR